MIKACHWAPIQGFATEHGVSVNSLRRFLNELQIAPVFDVNGVECLFRDDALELADLIDACGDTMDVLLTSGGQVRHRSGVEIWLNPKVQSCKSFGVALRNLWLRLDKDGSLGNLSVKYLHGAFLTCASEEIGSYISDQAKRIAETSSSGTSAFTRSVSYLGSKRLILDFVIETFSRYVGFGPTKLLDLMCGSGVVSAATSKFLCETYASDSLDFCSNLAITISNSVSPGRMLELRSQLLPLYETNYKILGKELEYWLAIESDLLVSDPKSAIDSYRTFLSTFPRYPMGSAHGWDPLGFVDRVRSSESKSPYGLVTAYFANAYFGLRQSIELDSVRFAIDGIDVDDKTRKHLMGVLVITASRMASSYGGHFAQPRYANAESVTDRNIGRLLDLRARSIWHEFLVRLEVLGTKAEVPVMEIHALRGPWQQALEEFGQAARTNDLVYIDPPYTREEASRYYHLLETLTKYNYPQSQGKGLAPPKGVDRFISEFFTRSALKFASRLREVLLRPLELGFVVLLSYADDASCSIPEIIDGLELDDLRISGFLTRHLHRGHGKGKDKLVQEYIVAIRRDER